MMNDPLTSTLPEPIDSAFDGKYLLRYRVPGTTGYSIWQDYIDDDGSLRSFKYGEDYLYAEDFLTYVDALQEETRVMFAAEGISFTVKDGEPVISG